MPPADHAIDLTLTELREIARYAVTCAEIALPVYARARADDDRPHTAVAEARAFAAGGPRTKSIRDAAWAAQRAYQETRDAGEPAAGEAARAALATASAPYLHPLAKPTQVWHILGPAARAAHALELDAADPATADEHLAWCRAQATPTVRAVLARYPAAPPGHGRAGDLLRTLDTALRQPSTAF